MDVAMLYKSNCVFQECLSDFLYFKFLVTSQIILVQLRTMETYQNSSRKMRFLFS